MKPPFAFIFIYLITITSVSYAYPCNYIPIQAVSLDGEKIILADYSVYKASQGDDAFGWREGDTVLVCRDRIMINESVQDDMISVNRID